MADLPKTQGTATVLRFDPPYPVFRIEVGDEFETVITDSLEESELKSRMRIAIPNPWAPDDERYLPGIAYGDGTQFIMDVGQSFGSLTFNETFGWCCVALIPKSHVMAGVVQELLQKAKVQSVTPTPPMLSFTDRLIKRSSKVKKATRK